MVKTCPSFPPTDRDAHGILQKTAWKIRGIAYLIECHRDHGGTPIDVEEVWLGIGALLTECSGAINEVRKKIDEPMPKLRRRRVKPRTPKDASKGPQ